MSFRLTTSLIRVEYAQALRLMQRNRIVSLQSSPDGWVPEGGDWYITDKVAERFVNNGVLEYCDYSEFSDGKYYPTRLRVFDLTR